MSTEESLHQLFSSDAFQANGSLSLLATQQPATAPAATIGPGGPAPFPVHYSVTIIITTLVAILFILVYMQLIMVICFGYKLVTYQTLLLFDILLWAALRLTLYSFYFFHCCDLVTSLDGSFWGWFLVAFPSALQYFSLALLVHYFSESIFKVTKKRQEMASLVPPYRKMRKYRILAEFLWVSSLIVFFGSSLAFYFLIDSCDVGSKLRSVLVILRVVLLDGLFLIMGIILGVCIIMIYTTKAGKDVLDAQGGGKCVPPLISCLLILIFASRDIYSIVAASLSDAHSISSSSYWIFATDEGDYGALNRGMHTEHYGYIAYFAVLLIWEVMPTYIIVFFFRVRIPRYHGGLQLRLNGCSSSKKKTPPTNQRHFFENPNRYDEQEQSLLYPSLKRHGSTSTHVSIPSLTGSTAGQPHPPVAHPYSHYSNNGYGSTNRGSGQLSKQYSINGSHHHHHGNGSHPIHGSVMPGTTPPQLFTSPSFLTDR